MEWKEALKSANAYERIAEEMKTHVLWGAREQTAIGHVTEQLARGQENH